VLVGFWCSLLVEVLGGLATAGLLAALVAFREAANHIEAHDRDVRALDEDIRRFIRDRDRILKVELATETTRLAARGLFHSGPHLVALIDRKRQALQDYRDEITGKRRLYREICESEGWATDYCAGDAGLCRGSSYLTSRGRYWPRGGRMRPSRA
jgi:hypothetical protein